MGIIITVSNYCCGKVFTSVCHSVHRGGLADTLGQTPRQAHRPGRHTPQADNPQADTPLRRHPLGGHLAAPPPETASAADCMHPTGMVSR